jgi:hypothetical protein
MPNPAPSIAFSSSVSRMAGRFPLEVPVWHFKFSNSKSLSLNEKSSGKRLLLRFAARMSAPVSNAIKGRPDRYRA